ncbi:MAG: hypothetical protein NZL95_01505 [Chitinophagales bacterium]|nr:hypothetical protein [Chitinophagales bacterium]MDW8427212.1 hypothetical protein [Chitinophagales bacterium]
MNDYEVIRSLAGKILLVLDEIKNKHGHVSVLQKDLLVLYSKELVAATNRLSCDLPAAEPLTPSDKSSAAPSVPSTNPMSEYASTTENNVPPQERQSLSERYRTQMHSLNDRLRRHIPDVADRLRLTPIRDLKAYIGLNRRFTYVGLLFNDDEARFEEVITHLNQCRGLQEALEYLDREVSGPLNWDKNSEVVQEFMTLIQRRYL